MLNYICSLSGLISAYFQSRTSTNDRGYTLLEYCAGAAIMAGVVWGAMQVLGNGLSGFLQGLSAWATNRAADIQ